MSEDLQGSIIEALKALPLRPDTSEMKLRYHAQRIGIDLYMVANSRWERSTPIQVVKELDRYSKALANLTRAVANMSQGALDLLETTYLSEEVKGAFRREPKRPGMNIMIEPEPSTLGVLPHCLQPSLHEYLLHTTKRAADDLRGASDNRGNKPKSVAHWLAGRLAQSYYELTGEKPRGPRRAADGELRGPFYDLIDACFRMAKLKASRERLTNLAVKGFVADDEIGEKKSN